MKQRSVPGLALLGVLVLCLIASPAAAHSPSNIVLSYDAAAGMLTATITHEVANPQTHYINEVRVMVNSATVVNMQYTSQPNNTVFTYTYPIQASAGSTISLRAECNIEGERTQTLLVGGATQTATPTMTTMTTTPTMTVTATTTTVATTQTTAATTLPTTVPSTTAQAPGFALWAGILGLAAAGCVLLLRR